VPFQKLSAEENSSSLMLNSNINRSGGNTSIATVDGEFVSNL